MSEPITLYRGDRTQITYAPSVARQLEANGWSRTPPAASPDATMLASSQQAPPHSITLRKDGYPDTATDSEERAKELEAEGWARVQPEPAQTGQPEVLYEMDVVMEVEDDEPAEGTGGEYSPPDAPMHPDPDNPTVTTADARAAKGKRRAQQ